MKNKAGGIIFYSCQALLKSDMILDAKITANVPVALVNRKLLESGMAERKLWEKKCAKKNSRLLVSSRLFVSVSNTEGKHSGPFKRMSNDGKQRVSNSY